MMIQLTILFPTPLLPSPPPPPTNKKAGFLGSKSAPYSGYDKVIFAEGIGGAIWNTDVAGGVGQRLEAKGMDKEPNGPLKLLCNSKAHLGSNQ
jgi:hypothetical protein